MDRHRIMIVEGNNGGDYLEFLSVDGDNKPLADGMIHLKIGHCCVHTIDVIMPVEILTGFLVDKLVLAYKEPWQRAAKDVWDAKYAKELAKKVIDFMDD